MVTLVLSGALISGCNNQSNQTSGGDWDYADQSVTNNTYVAGRGYYHAPYHAWYEYPYNYYRPGYGYYYGGLWNPARNESTVVYSKPGYSGSSGSSSHFSSSSSHSSSSISRGGFGHSGSSSS